MAPLITDDLVFSRRGLWSDPPRTWANGPVVCEGQHVKAVGLVPAAAAWANAEFLLRRVPDGADVKLDIMTRERMPGVERLLAAGEFGPGPYLIELKGTPHMDEVPHLPGGHELLVVSRNEFREHWLTLLSGEWDEPIYWDSATPEQIEDLMTGLPLAPLSAGLVTRMRTGRGDLLQLIGPIAGVLIADSFGGTPPFGIRFETAQQQGNVPRMDLTKVIWLLQALAPVWADAAFFSRFATIATSLSETQLQITFRFSIVPEMVGKLKSIQPLIDTINESGRSGFRFELVLDNERAGVVMFPHE